MQGVLKLGTFDTEKYSFTKRTSATTAPFAEKDSEALSKVLGALEAKNYGKPTDTYSPELLTLIDRGNSFGDMYALTMHKLDQESKKSDLLPIVAGEWKPFEKGSDPQQLVESLAGKRSNLCIADIGSATRYLTQGVVEVYFSHNETQQSTIPRIAIAYDAKKGGVYEVRGTYNKNEDTDPYIEESGILMEHLRMLPNGESFAKKDADMKRMTELYRRCFRIDKKTKEKIPLNPVLTKDDLQFLYEINSSIEGFGYQKDPRIAELRGARNIEQDMLVIFDCTPEEIAHDQSEIHENTKAYVGQWSPEVYQALPTSVAHIYESFPDKPIFRRSIETDPALQTPEQVEKALITGGHRISDYAKDILYKTPFSTEKIAYNLVSFSVAQLGFPGRATLSQIYAKAQELGLELCPAEVGPLLRLQYTNQPGDQYLRIAMQPMAYRGRLPALFRVNRDSSSSWLRNDFGLLVGEWDGGFQFVFLSRK
jgi:hypothetical protein